MTDQQTRKGLVAAALVLAVVLAAFWGSWFLATGRIPVSSFKLVNGEKVLEISWAWSVVWTPFLIISLSFLGEWLSGKNKARKALGAVCAGNVLVSLCLVFWGEMALSVVLFAGYAVVSTLLVGTAAMGIWAVRRAIRWVSRRVTRGFIRWARFFRKFILAA